MSSGIVGADLTNSGYWELESFVLRSVSGAGENAFRPIGNVALPIFQRSRIMAATFENSVARPWWYRGCWLNQLVAVNAIGSSLANVASWHVPLVHPLIFMPDTAPLVWQLSVSVPYWHKEARITIYRFTGEIDLPLSTKLEEILARLP